MEETELIITSGDMYAVIIKSKGLVSLI